MESKSKPPGYWTERRIRLEAKKYEHKSDFKRTSPSAHRTASKLGIFESVTSHMLRKEAPRMWTVENVIAEAQRYRFKSDFRRLAPGAYAVLLDHKLMPLLAGHFQKKPSSARQWSYSEILAVAKTFITRTAFFRGGRGAYKAAQRAGVLEEVSKHMERKSAPVGYWTKERILEKAKRFKDRTSFIREAPGAYTCAVKLGILDQAYAHMKRIGSKYQRALYAFEFSDKSVYVGLTFNYDKRYAEHLTKSKALKVKIDLMEHRFVRFDEWYPSEIAAKLEARKIAEYRNNGWTILNKVRAGGLGKDKIWTPKMVKERASNFENMFDFRTKDPKAYSAAARLRILPSLRKGLSSRIRPHGYWKLQTIRKEALRFSNRSEFQDKASSAHQAAKRLGILDKVCRHMKRRSVPKGYWTFERITEAARKYDRYTVFLKNEKAAASAARRMGVLEEVASELKRDRAKQGFWNKPRISEEAKKYEHRGDFFKGSTSAYNAARALGVLKDMCSHMRPKENLQGTRVVVAGKNFNSIAALEKHYSLRRGIVNDRLKLGWSLEEAVGLVKRVRPGHGLTINFRGKTFRSRNALCRHYGVSERLVEGRCLKGWSLEEALGLKERPFKGGPKAIIIHAKSYKSIASACKALGLNSGTIRARMTAGWTHEQAFGLVPAPTRKIVGTTVRVSGSVYPSIGSAARAYGLSAKLVDERLRSGWTIEEALEQAGRVVNLRAHRANAVAAR